MESGVNPVTDKTTITDVSVKRQYCPIHQVFEDLVRETQIDDITFEQEFSCGFKNKLKKMPTIYENIKISGFPEAKIYTVKSSANVPVVVSGASQNQYFGSATFELSVDKGLNLVNYGNMEIKYVGEKSSFVNNIQNIFSMVDSNNTYTPEEKVVIKDTLTKITDLINATGSAAGKFAPYLTMLGDMFH